MTQLVNYPTFRDMCTSTPEGHNNICVHLVAYNIKHDLRHTAHLIADSHLTDSPLKSRGKGIILLPRTCLLASICKLNGLDLLAMDIPGTTYFEQDQTKEKVFGNVREGIPQSSRRCYLICTHQLYGGTSIVLTAHHLMKASPTPTIGNPKPDRIWMRPNGDAAYELIAI